MANYPYARPGTQLDDFRESIIEFQIGVEQDIRNVQGQVSKVIADGDSSPQAAAAAVDLTGKTYKTLKERVDADQKAVLETRVELLSEIGNKRNKSEKIKSAELDISADAYKIQPIHLSAETKKMMAGTTPVNAEPAAGGVNGTHLAPGAVTTEKIQTGSVQISKRTIDIFPRNPEQWSDRTVNFKVGEEYSPPSGYIQEGSGEYRKDTLELFKVKPGSTITINIESGSLYQVAIHEYDAAKKGVKDAGYKTGIVTFSNTTEWIRLVVATKDYSNTTIEHMLENSKVTAEIPATEPYKENEYKESWGRLVRKQINTNFLDLNPAKWEKGSLTTAADGTTLFYTTTENRLRYIKNLYVEDLGDYKRLYFNVPDGYELSLNFLTENNSLIYSSPYLKGAGYIPTPKNLKKVLPVLKKTGDTNISINEFKTLNLVLSFKVSKFVFSRTDTNEAIRAIQDIQSTAKQNNAFSGLFGMTRYVGHGGTYRYGQENTLEAYRIIAEICRYWGAECDLAITKDGELVLMHDYTLDRTTTGTGNVSDYTLAQIKEMRIKADPNLTIPTFEEYLDTCKRYGLYPIIEVKGDGHTTGMADKVIQILKKRNLEEECILISFGLDTLKYMRALSSKVKMAFILQVHQEISADTINTVKNIGNCTLDVYYEKVTKAAVDLCHANGLPVIVWTLNDETKKTDIINMGIDMLTTDQLLPDTRQRCTYSASMSTNDKGQTWTIVDLASRNLKINAAPLDEYTIGVTIPSYLSLVTDRLFPISKVQDIRVTNTPMQYHSYVAGGKINIKFLVNGTMRKLSELPESYYNLVIELTY